jgi:hypothetical protein
MGKKIKCSLNIMSMKNKYGLTDLSELELMECNGGKSMIDFLLASNCVIRLMDFVEGLKAGYARATQI